MRQEGAEVPDHVTGTGTGTGTGSFHVIEGEAKLGTSDGETIEHVAGHLLVPGWIDSHVASRGRS